MNKNHNGVEIAIIGMAGKFPGAESIDEFWENLKNGVESISFFSDEELKAEGVSDNDLKDPNYVKANAFVNSKEFFDSEFFGYGPVEAALMDPQLRLFHEVCWKALEDAGYDTKSNTEKVGLFAGGSTHINWMNYSILAGKDHGEYGFSASLLRDVTFLCSRVSYELNLRGPSVYLNTACSTSLVAVQKACMSLLLRECKMALAGGVTIKSHTKKGYRYIDGMVNSKDGHCRAFDAQSNGAVGGEGVGVVVLKRLEEAIADGDNIHAIIRGSGLNNDGNQKISFTAPSIDGQSQAILKALSMAGVSPETIGYVETHGTATHLGDPIEIEALSLAFGKSSRKYCALGSVKTNIGHLDSAAGIAGLIKAVLSLKHRQIPPSLHFTEPNPKINFLDTPFFVNTAVREWKNGEVPLRAGVSSFGIGGTNAHVILEEAPILEPSSDSRHEQMFVFSAKSLTALNNYLVSFKNFVEGNKDLKLSDIAYTLHVGRCRFPFRKAFVCRTREEVMELCSASNLKNVKPLSDKINYSIVFMFSGQGSQYLNMCQGLYDQEQLFRKECDRCFDIVNRISGKDMKSVIFSTKDEAKSSRINDTEFTQPSLFIIEYALSRLLMEWGIMPNMMIGHSFGEYVAACISGVLSLEDALSLVVTRGKLMQRVSKGKMLGISIAENQLTQLLKDNPQVALATVNSSELNVVSGSDEAIDNFKITLEQNGYNYKVIPHAHAYHSHIMNEILEEFGSALKGIKLNEPTLPFISNVTGKPILTSQVTNPQYWVDHLRQTVRFSDGIEYLFNQKNAVFIEVGPGVELSVFVRSNKLREEGHKVINVVRHEDGEGNDLRYLLTALAKLWTIGVEPKWDQFYAHEKRKRISIPTYSFDRLKYPVNVDAFKMLSDLPSSKLLVGENDISDWFYVPTWKKSWVISKYEGSGFDFCNVVFADSCGVSDAVIGKILQCKEQVVCIRVGDDFKELAGNEYTVNPEIEAHFISLFKSLTEKNLLPDRIIHAWAISDRNESETYDDISARSAVYTGFYSLYHLVKASKGYGGILEKELVVLSNNLHAIADCEVSLPAQALSLGILKVVSQEYPTVITGHIDISLSETGNDKFTEALFNEITKKETGKIVSLRNSQRWIQIFDAVKPANGKAENFKERGVYLITGGLGEIGYNLTKHLLKAYQAKVILIGRTQLPDREDWAEFIERQSNSPDVKERIVRLLELEKSEGAVMYVTCDIADKNAVATITKSAEESFGRINGIVHGAGIIKGSSINPLTDLSISDFEFQFRSKMTGIHVLKEVMQNRELDFCLILSSLSAVLGGLGFAAYAPANIYMDYFVKSYRDRRQLTNWISVDFEDFDFKNQYKIGEVFDSILSLKAMPQIVMSKTDLNKRLEKWINRNVINESGVSSEVGLLINDSVSTSKEQRLILMWENFFGKSPISVDDDFFDIGGDSLKALTMIGRIYKIFSIEIPVKVFFNSSTIQQLCTYMEEKEKSGEEKLRFKPVSKASVKEYYPLSSSQRRLYFLYEFDRNSLAYNITNVTRLDGIIDKERIRLSFIMLIERHESLRTSFEVIGDQLVLKVLNDFKFEVEHFKGNIDDVNEIIEQFVRPFELDNGPLLRVGLIEIDSTRHFLILDLHHIIADGISFNILIKDFLKYYKGENLPELALQYKDYTEWQQSTDHLCEIEKQKDFWLAQFSEELAPIQLPTDFQRPINKNYAGSSFKFSLDSEESSKLKAIAQREGATMFTAVLSVFNILLSKLTNSNDITVGTTVAGRNHPDLENIIGMFVNTLPLRNNPKGEMSFRNFLINVKERTIACFNNQDYPYEDLIVELNVERDTSRNPLFDVMFSYLNFADFEPEMDSLVLKPYDTQHQTSLFDLTLWAIEENNTLQLRFEYPTALFLAKTIERLASYFKRIVSLIDSQGDILISDIDSITPEEKHQILEEFNNTKGDYLKGQTIVSLFENQVLRTPNKQAVFFERSTLTYKELNERSNQIGHYLRERYNIKPNDLVAIMCNRSDWMLAAMMGILKSGAAYIPIDPSYPEDRIAYVLEDSGAGVLLTDQTPSKALGYKGEVVKIDLIKSDKKDNIRCICASDDLCYVIYTSGSTGKPKGVMITHNNVMNFFAGMIDKLPVQKNDCMLAITSTSFDISVLELFWTLCHGIEIVIHPSDISVTNLDRYVSRQDEALDFSLFFFSSYNNKTDDRYNLLLESVRYADDAGFNAVWTPERHFHEFGGLFPNPSVVSAALAMVTSQIELRSGSIVSPLHDEMRIAEEWSVVDNLSGGRVGLSFASGWNPNDFVFDKGSYKDRHKTMYEQIDVIKKLWSGKSIRKKNGYGQEVDLCIFPAPVQRDLPIWITSAGSEETFRSAGAIGAHVLTHLLGQDLEGLSKKIKLYRESRKQHGYNPEEGKVAIMLHTYIGEDINEVERLVEGPFIEYLRSSISLSKTVFEEAGLKEGDLTKEVQEMILKNAFKRYYETGSLIGTKHNCMKMLHELKAIGVDEVACLVDFGIDENKVLEGLKHLKALKEMFLGHDRLVHKPITMMQCTPSFMKLIRQNDESQEFLQSLNLILLGGEPLPTPILQDLKKNLRATIYNMYGPTETTIWSSVYKFENNSDKISVGKPILNTQLYILNNSLEIVPVGVVGELYIGGEGVAKGYLHREALTRERFIDSPFNKNERIYKTGDLAKWLPDGNVELIGRSDDQVKIRGFRIELGEIERVLETHDMIKEATVLVKENEGDKVLTAYYTTDGEIESGVLRKYVANKLPDYMVPAFYIQMPLMPLTPNGKLNKNAFPNPSISRDRNDGAPATAIEEKLIEIWTKVLNIDRKSISIRTNFFEVGGHSINIMTLTRMINREFECNISIANMFRLPTIESIGDFIARGDHDIKAVAENIDVAISEGNANLQLLEDLINQ